MRTTLILAALGAASGDRSSWMDRSKSPAARAEALLAVLSQEEKIALTFATHTSSSHAQQHSKTGIGAVKYMSAFKCAVNDPEGCVAQRNALQSLFLNQSAHGIPISFINEGLHGGASGGTIFPEPITQSMSWNASLVTLIGEAIAAEASAIGVDTVFAPVVNMMPDPRFGRLQEGFGENPTVASTLGAAAVAGLQGAQNGPEHYGLPGKVCSLGKHFAAYGAAAGGLNGGPADVSNRTLHEVYLRPWLALSHAGVRAVMPAHQTVHDVPCHANEWLMRTLRDGMGFGNGVALSDCNDVGQNYHARLAANRSHAAALSLAAGVDWDLQCGTDEEEWGYGNNHLKTALADGLVPQAALERSARRVLQQKFASNLFDAPLVSIDGVRDKLDTAAHRSLAREAAEQGVVLLRNVNGTLPLATTDANANGRYSNANGSDGGGTLRGTRVAVGGTLRGTRVAVLGPLANGSEATTALVGSYVLPGARVVTVTEALATLGATVTTARGCDASGDPATACPAADLAHATALAAAADVTVLVLGDGDGECGEWRDRDSLEMGGGQLQLLREVARVASAAGKPLVLVLVHGRPQTFGVANEALELVGAVVSAWRPGEEGGTAIARVLTGAVNPSGKLTQSWPRTVGHVGSGAAPWLQRVRGKWVANQKGCDALATTGRCVDPYTDSRFDPSPLFPFGFGLTFAAFTYRAMRVEVVMEASELRGAVGWRGEFVGKAVWRVSVEVSNEAAIDGAEVVQLYVRDPAGQGFFVPYWRRLVAFGRVYVSGGGVATLTLDVAWEHLAQFDGEMQLRVMPGEYDLYVGGDAEHTPLSARVVV